MGVFDRFKQVLTRTTTSDRASDENHCSFRVGIRGTGVIKSISPTGESAGDNDWVDMEIEDDPAQPRALPHHQSDHDAARHRRKICPRQPAHLHR